jgi:PAS domain S-box-containing protein
MNRISPIVLISLCLVFVTIGAMLAGQAIVGVTPDQPKEVFEARKTLCENLAVQYSLLAASGQIATIEMAMRALVERNSDILSAALQAADGSQLAAAGDHLRNWVQPTGQRSTPTHIQVPIYKETTHWGTLQLSFRALGIGAGKKFYEEVWLQYVLLVAVLGFLGYFTFMKRTLRHLDPSEMIPPRVKSTLDSLTDGVAMVDLSGSIVLANETFCRLTERSLSSLLGQSLSRLPWVDDHGMSLASDYRLPWQLATDHVLGQQGVRLGYRTKEQELQTLSVTTTPIQDQDGRTRGVLVSFHDVTAVDQANSKLREAIVKLEQSQTQVLVQNERLEQTNEVLQLEIEERKRVQVEREQLHKQLVESSRLVGMADVASTVMHNVGNVLNSVNVSVDVVSDLLKQTPMNDVALIASLLQAHTHDLGKYLSEHQEGRQIPSYLSMLAEAVTQNQGLVLKELDGLGRNIEHIRQVVNRQIDLARSGGAILEPVCFQDLMEQALAIYRQALESRGYEIERCYDEVPQGMCDRHQVLQILVNLISNAKNAIDAEPGKSHRITLRLGLAEDRPAFVRFQVIDTGIGIAPEHVPRLFTQGFTTRPDGHGIGLHSAALAAQNLGGTLQGRSKGRGHGAAFVLDLPLHPVEVPV